MIVYTNGTETGSRLNDLQAEGKKLFQEHNCIACHQIYGLGGYLGADLTTVITTSGKGEEYARSFIRYGTNQMPDFNLNEKEIGYIIEYLRHVDKTATTYKEL